MSGIGLQKSATQDALERLRRLLNDDRFTTNGKLPPERDLAETLDVGRSTLRKALDILEAEGEIWRHVGQGTFLGNRQSARRKTLLLDDVRSVTPKELLDARLALEPSIAASAAMTATPDDIAHLKECAEKRENATDPEPYNLWDHRFHLALAQATQNPILVALIEQFNALRRTPNWSEYKVTRMGEPYYSISAKAHRAIIAAIETRDSNAAFRAMRDHILSVQEGFFDWSTAKPAEPT